MFKNLLIPFLTAKLEVFTGHHGIRVKCILPDIRISRNLDYINFSGHHEIRLKSFFPDIMKSEKIRSHRIP